VEMQVLRDGSIPREAAKGFGKGTGTV